MKLLSIEKLNSSISTVFVLMLCTLLSRMVRGEPEIPPWHLDRLDQLRGIDSAPFQANVVARTRPVLYVIDSGVNREHKEFTSGSSKVLDGYNFVEESWDSSDCMGHGTHVAGLAAGRRYGVAGSIGVDIVSVRILDCMGRGSCSSMIRGLEWVHGNHSALRAGVPGVVVMSVGSRQSECEGAYLLAESLAERNIIVIAAAGNSGSDACMFHPASAQKAITVGALELKNAGDSAWSKTNFGDCVDIFAPGVSVESAWPGSVHNNGSKVLSGTSMAAPLVAGQALLIVAAIPGISAPNTRKIIEQSASRGTLLGSQINPEAPGSRVARVPWLNVHPRRVVGISQGNTSLSSDEIRFMYDTVKVEIRTTSSTNPAMQYAVEHIATNLHSFLKDTESSNLFVRCSGNESSGRTQPKSTTRTRGWDVRQKTDEAGVLILKIACNISSDAGSGKVVTGEISKTLRAGLLRDITGNIVTLLSKPALMRAQAGAKQKGLSTWKTVLIAISSSGLFITGTVVLIFSRRRRHFLTS